MEKKSKWYFKNYIGDAQDYAIEHSGTCLKVADKPKKNTEKSNMGAKRVTPEEIVEMLRLYPKLGTYAAAGREIGRSAATIARYVKMENIPQNIRLAVDNLLNRK